jgi:hypothetical protein
MLDARLFVDDPEAQEDPELTQQLRDLVNPWIGVFPYQSTSNPQYFIRADQTGGLVFRESHYMNNLYHTFHLIFEGLTTFYHTHLNTGSAPKKVLLMMSLVGANKHSAIYMDRDDFVIPLWNLFMHVWALYLERYNSEISEVVSLIQVMDTPTINTMDGYAPFLEYIYQGLSGDKVRVKHMRLKDDNQQIWFTSDELKNNYCALVNLGELYGLAQSTITRIPSTLSIQQNPFINPNMLNPGNYQIIELPEV